MLLPALLIALTGSPPPSGGEALLRQIHADHHATWFRTVVFEQRTSYPATPGRVAEHWYETMRRPGFLRIDMERGDSSTGGMIFRHDSLYQFKPGQPAGAGRPLTHTLLILLHDLHVGNIDSTIARLKTAGFDLDTTDSTAWQGRPTIVVGAAVGDTTRPQFWVDPEREVVVRVLQPGPRGLSDTRITEYSSLGKAGLVERRVEFWSAGDLQVVEEYAKVEAGVKLGASVFDPASTAELPRWVVERKGGAGG